MTRRDALCLAGVSLLGRFSPVLGKDDNPGDGVVHYGNEQSYEITHRASLATGDADLSSLELWLPVPMDCPEQTVERLVIQPKLPVRTDVMSQATVAVLLKSKSVPRPGQSLSVELNYTVKSRSITVDWERLNEAELGEYKQDRDFRTFTRPEKKIEAKSADIKRTAKEIADRAQGPLEFARQAYDWVIEHTKYQILPDVEGARYCFKQGHGECTEYAALFVALCRAAGIPARPVVGLWAEGNDRWHVWAEFMLPSGDWLPIDPTAGDKGEWAYRQAFGFRENKLVVLCKTYEIRIPKKSRGQRSIEFLQAGAIWWKARRLKPGGKPPHLTLSVTGRAVDS